MKRLEVILVCGLLYACSDSEELVNRPGDDVGTSETGGGGADASEDSSTDPAVETDVSADPCAERDDLCAAEGSACAEAVLVLCEQDGDGCLVERSVDCGVLGEVCVESEGAAACGPPACEHECDAVGQVCESEENKDVIRETVNAMGLASMEIMRQAEQPPNAT